MNSVKILRFLNKNSTVMHSKVPLPSNLNKSFRTTTNVSVSPSKKEKDIFQDTLPSILESIVKSPKLAEVPTISTWIKKVLEYNLAGGKLNRGLTTVFAYEMLEKPENINEKNLKNARIMGWCVEMLQAYLLILDDIMDGSSTRRGVPCWYRIPEVGLGAINDAILVQSSIYQLLKMHFSDKQYYTSVVETFNEVLMYTSMGQHLDFTMAHRNKNDYSQFTKAKYEAITKYKTAYYTYKLPVCLGLYLTNSVDKGAHDKVENICIDIGKYFQSQDDFIDCFGDESVTGKAGTDIQEGKCTWLAVTALQLCTPPQRIVFEACYGSKEPAHVDRIKELYKKLDIENVFRREEQNTYENITAQINSLPKDLSPTLFHKILDMIHKRKL